MELEEADLERVDDRLPWEGGPCSGPCQFLRLAGAERDCATCARLEVASGFLRCRGCGANFRVDQGIPRLLLDGSQASAPAPERLVSRTGASYGFLWSTGQPETRLEGSGPYHFEKIESSVPFDVKGLVLDAGCGDGSDLSSIARRPAVEVIGVDLSADGARVSFERVLRWPNAHVVQADIRRLPFRPGRFDCVYSYGVLHHLPKPDQGLSELVRVLAPSGVLAAYVYEDLSEQPLVWKWLLGATNQLRRVTTRLPHRALYVACWAASPVMFLLFTLPYRAFRGLGVNHPLTAAIPFRHASDPMSLVGDLFDRFSAPVEHRYSRAAVECFMRRAGLSEVTLAHEGGWMVLGLKREG